MGIDVVGIGTPIMDFLMDIDRLPKTDGVTGIHEYSWQGGGKVPTAMVTLGRLGVRAAMAGVVGGDAFGSFCVEDFKRHGLDASHVIVDKDATTTFAVCIAERLTRGRSFLGKRGSCRRLETSDLDKKLITSAKYLHMSDMHSVNIEASTMARAAGVKVVYDADMYDVETKDNLNRIDAFIASEFFYTGMFSDGGYELNCRKLQALGPDIVVITLGERGSVGVYGDQYFEIPACTNVNVVDTTGAGDVFHGAFIFGMLQEWDMERIVRFASAVAAIKCTRLGGRVGIPGLAEVERFMADGFIDYTGIDKRVAFYRNGIFTKD